MVAGLHEPAPLEGVTASRSFENSLELALLAPGAAPVLLLGLVWLVVVVKTVVAPDLPLLQLTGTLGIVPE